MEAARALKQQEIIEDDRFWPIPDMAEGMRVEHDRLVQLGWVYDGFGGYRKKAASSHPGPKLAASNALNVSASVLRRRGYRVCNSTGRRTLKSRRGDDGNGAQLILVLQSMTAHAIAGSLLTPPQSDRGLAGRLPVVLAIRSCWRVHIVVDRAAAVET